MRLPGHYVTSIGLHFRSALEWQLHMSELYVYVGIFAVDLISLFSRIHPPTAKLSKFCTAILTRAPHQSQATSMSPYHACGSF